MVEAVCHGRFFLCLCARQVQIEPWFDRSISGAFEREDELSRDDFFLFWLFKDHQFERSSSDEVNHFFSNGVGHLSRISFRA